MARRWMLGCLGILLLAAHARAQDGLGPEIRFDRGTAMRHEAPLFFEAGETWGFTRTSTGIRRVGAPGPTEENLGIEGHPEARGAVAGDRAALAWRGEEVIEVALFGRETSLRRRSHPAAGDVRLDVAASGDDVVVAWTTERDGAFTLRWVRGEDGTVRETSSDGALERLWCGSAACIASIADTAGPSVLAFAVRDASRTSRAALGFVPELAGRRDDAGEHWTVHASSGGRWMRQDLEALAGLVDPVIDGGPLPDGMHLVGAEGAQAIAVRTTRSVAAEVWSGSDPEPLGAFPTMIAATGSGALAIVTRELGRARFGRWTAREGYVEGPAYETTTSPVVGAAIGRELWLTLSTGFEPYGYAFVGLDEGGVIDAVIPETNQICAPGTAGYACFTDEGRVRIALSGRPPALTERLRSSDCMWPTITTQGDGFATSCRGVVHEISQEGRERSVFLPALDGLQTLWTSERDHYALIPFVGPWRLFVGTTPIPVRDGDRYERFALGRRLHVTYDHTIRSVDWDGTETALTLARPTYEIGSLAETPRGLLAVIGSASPPHLSRLRRDGTEAVGPGLLPTSSFEAENSLAVYCANDARERCAVTYSYLEAEGGARRFAVRWLSSVADGAACGTDFACVSGSCVSGVCEGDTTDRDAGPESADAGSDAGAASDAGVADRSDAGAPSPAPGCGCAATRPTAFFAPALTVWMLLVVMRARRRAGQRCAALAALTLVACNPLTPSDDAAMDAATDAPAIDAPVIDAPAFDAPANDAPSDASLDAACTECAGACVELDSDPQHCGRCGARCATGEVCADGACARVCRAGTLRCGDRCVDLLTHPGHCGGCDEACGPDEVCMAGECALSCAPRATCDGRCADLNSDPLNCGACGAACGRFAACSVGVCVCEAGYTACGSECVDVDLDASHCGGCGVACAPDQSCLFGTCGRYETSWPTLGGSPGRTGLNAGERGGPPLTLVARPVLEPSYPLLAPVIVGGRVFVSSNDFSGSASLLAYALTDGTPLFRRDFDRRIGPPTVDGEALYVHRDLDAFFESRLYRFDLEGAEQWSVPIPARAIESSVLAVEGSTYVEGLVGSLRAFDGAGVERFASGGTERSGWAASSDEGFVYTFIQGALRRYDDAGVEHVIMTSLGGYPDTHPTLVGGRAYVSGGGIVAAIDLATERVLWSATGAGPLVVAGPWIFFLGRGLEAHTIDDGALRWSAVIGVYAAPVATARHLYVPAYGYVEVIDLESGASVARIEETGELAIGEGHLVIRASAGLSIYRLSP